MESFPGVLKSGFIYLNVSFLNFEFVTARATILEKWRIKAEFQQYFLTFRLMKNLNLNLNLNLKHKMKQKKLEMCISRVNIGINLFLLLIYLHLL